jgi:hypothetical protein
MQCFTSYSWKICMSGYLSSRYRKAEPPLHQKWLKKKNGNQKEHYLYVMKSFNCEFIITNGMRNETLSSLTVELYHISTEWVKLQQIKKNNTHVPNYSFELNRKQNMYRLSITLGRKIRVWWIIKYPVASKRHVRWCSQ